ncbi:MAG TPA: HAD-IC family P-type ATPase, partial [Chitinophagaceae bacterium]|nr:HAD-IC family P-type ATPase [Chitinophagaceae bacterium]
MITKKLKEQLKAKIGFSRNGSYGFGENALKKLNEVSCSDSNSFLALLNSDIKGLSGIEVEKNQLEFGLNEIEHEKAPAWYKQLFYAFLTPFNAVLLIIATVSIVIDVFLAAPADKDYKTVIVVITMVLLSSLLRFWQEYSSNQAAKKLKSMVKTTATLIRRDSGKIEIDIKEIVPGDIILLSAGDMIPADCRILQSKDLFVSQSILTGEALPVEKREHKIDDAKTRSPLELDNLCFMGTNIVSGTATAVAVTTGNETYFGSIGKALTGQRPLTSFDKGVNKISWLLIRFMLIMVPLVFFINGLTKGNWFEALLFGLSVAVGLTPEMLPMIVTANLAKGAMKMGKRKVIVKRLNAIQNIGAMDILCTDKTGTLTLDKIVLTRHLNVYGDDDDEVMKWAYLNSYYQTGLKNLLDVAVLEHNELHHNKQLEEAFRKIDEIPFDFQRRRMSVILEEKNGKHLLICKGAVEEMLEVCSHAFDPGEDKQLQISSDKIVPMNDAMRKIVSDTSMRLNEDGL